MITALPPVQEKYSRTEFKDFALEAFEEGREEGVEKLLVKFIKKNPTWSVQEIAEYFELAKEFVAEVKAKLGNPSTTIE